MKLVTKARSHPPFEQESGMRPGTCVAFQGVGIGNTASGRVFVALKSGAEKSTNHETDEL